jgi:hypothetical protein
MGVEIRGSPFNRKSQDRKEHHAFREMDVRSLSMRCHGCPEGVAIVSCVSNGVLVLDGENASPPSRPFDAPTPMW